MDTTIETGGVPAAVETAPTGPNLAARETVIEPRDEHVFDYGFMEDTSVYVERGETVFIYGSGPAENWALSPTGRAGERRLELMSPGDLCLMEDDKGMIRRVECADGEGFFFCLTYSLDHLVRYGWLVSVEVWNGEPVGNCRRGEPVQ